MAKLPVESFGKIFDLASQTEKEISTQFKAAEAGYWAKWGGHPVFRRARYLSIDDPSVYNPLRTPEDVLADKLITQGTIFSTSFDIRGASIEKGSTAEKALRLNIFKIFDRSIPYLWKNDIRLSVSHQEKQLPRHRIGENLLPAEVVWWTWETDIEVPGLELLCVSMLLIDLGDGIGGMQFYRTDSKAVSPQRCEVDGIFIPYGITFPDDLSNEAEVLGVDCILKMIAFVNSPYMCVEKKKPHRALRREIAKKGDEPLPDVSFVELRRAKVTAARPDGEGESPDWQWRWLVSGHFRAQWHASTKSHEIIWIAPHIKGPADKPIKPRVFRVAR